MLNSTVGRLPSEGANTPASAGSRRFSVMTVALATAATLIAGGATTYTFSQLQSTPAVETAPVAPRVTAVTALGRLEPQGEVIKLSAPASAEGSRVDQLLVKEGDTVKAGQPIAVLDSRDRLQAAAEEAQQRVGVAKANLDRVLAGAKAGEIEAQKATVARLEVERKNEIEAQKATIARIEAERKGEIEAQQAEIARIEAELQGDTGAQEATIARLEAELRNAESESKRYEYLLENGAVSASAGDSRRLTLAAAQERLNEARANLNRTKSAKAEQLKEARANLQKISSAKAEQLEEARANLDKIVSGKAEQVNEAKATLERIEEVRPEDVRASEAELKQAQAALKTALANLEKAYVKAPRDAQVLKIHTRPGELIAPEGIAELGDTSQMYAVAEVYESDVSKVRLNQPVRVSNDSLGEELRGTVERIGLLVKKQNVINTDPSANIDSRVVEVRVRLDADSSKKVAGLTNLQVKVRIDL